VGEVLLLREPEIRSALDMRSCIEAVSEAFAAYSSGGAELPNVIHLEVPEHSGEIHVKAGYLHGGAVYAVKFASGFPGNERLGLAVNTGMVCVFAAASGYPAALLFDNGYVTDLRTGAAGGVAARLLAPSKVDRVAVIGTGLQARYQLDALALERAFSVVRVWGRDADHARRCVEELRSREGMPAGASFEVAESIREAVDGAQVVITCTAAREPLVKLGWLAPGAHVTALGSDGPSKQELDPEILRAADLLIVDSLPQCRERGELQHAPDVEPHAEIGEVVSGAKPGRTGDEQLTVCDLTGVGVQDVAAAAVVLENARAAGLGEPVAL
jgi:ornithine cyclodeaminase